MEPEILIVLGIMLTAFICFAREWLPVDVVAILMVLTLIFTGILSVPKALAGFGHPAVIGVGALFVVSEGLLRTGALGVLANRLERWSGGNELRLKLLILSIVAISSAFLNNTPVVAMFIPVVLGLSRKLGINPSRLLIPLSFAAILGGTCTLIGTSTNIMVASIVESTNRQQDLELYVPSMFDFTGLGILLVSFGLVYLIFGAKYLLPERQTITSMTGGGTDLKDYVTELRIKPGGVLANQRFADTVLFDARGVRILQIIRGERILWPPFQDLVLASDDALVIAGQIQELMKLHEEDGLETLEEILAAESVDVSSKETELAELLILPNSPYVGQRLEEAHFRLHYSLNVLAIQRHGMHLKRKISEHPLRVGDLLLVQGTEMDLKRAGTEEGLVLMNEVDHILVRKSRARVAIAILFGVIVALSLGLFSMAAIALSGATAMVLTGCLSAGKIYEAIHWRVLILIAGTLALGEAMQSTGTANWVAQGLIDLFRFGGPHLLIFVALVMTTILTECVSNTAIAAVMVPIAIALAGQLGVSATPFIMAVAYGASCSFLTPIGYQTNTLVYGAGGYRFFDFVRVGFPLVLIVWLVLGTLIPVIWSF